MSLLGTLGKVLSIAGPIAAAPFTGGGSLLGLMGAGAGTAAAIGGGIGAAGSMLGNVGSVASGAAKGSADQRLREQQGLLGQQSLALQGARDQFGTGMDAAKFQQSEQDRQRKAAILAALLNGTQDQQITPGNPNIASRMPTVTGGARPSNLTNNKDLLLSLLSAPAVQAPSYQAPPTFALPQAGAGEKILGGVGLGTSLLGAIGPLLGGLGQPKRPQIGNVNDVLDRLGGLA